IIGYGTMIVPRTLDTPDGSYQYWRALDMYAVSYNPTSAGGTITASGLPLRKGLVAVDPRYIPLGTRLYVPGYGEALAADTGGGVHGRIIDLGYSDGDYEHWSRNVTVYFLWPPPENIAWIIP
ncbi:MAG: 3D domain-containing protein, partial [Anaerolineales bacterium]